MFLNLDNACENGASGYGFPLVHRQHVLSGLQGELEYVSSYSTLTNLSKVHCERNGLAVSHVLHAEPGWNTDIAVYS